MHTCMHHCGVHKRGIPFRTQVITGKPATRTRQHPPRSADFFLSLVLRGQLVVVVVERLFQIDRSFGGFLLVDAVVLGHKLVVSHPDAQRNYEVPLGIVSAG